MLFHLIKSLTKEVLEAEKSAYGKVIRVISHEVNNTVAGVTSVLDTVKSSMSDGSVERSAAGQDSVKQGVTVHNRTAQDNLVNALQVCTDRCMSMSNFITRFADVVKIPQPVLQPTDLNQVIENDKLLLENMCSSQNVKIAFNLDNRKFGVMLDVPMFEQVLINIVKNSVEGIREKSYAGVASKNSESTSTNANASASASSSVSDAGTVVIMTDVSLNLLEISDNGAGISKDTEQKLFTPFYSTKPNGQGIGLMTISEILTRHNFDFSLRTYPDGITRFRINMCGNFFN